MRLHQHGSAFENSDVIKVTDPIMATFVSKYLEVWHMRWMRHVARINFSMSMPLRHMERVKVCIYR